MRASCRLLAAIASLALATIAVAAPRYVATPLGTLGGDRSEGRAINASGQVTGRAQVADGAWHAYVYANGVMRDLDSPDGTDSVGNAINASGAVTGCATRDHTRFAFVHEAGVMLDIASLVTVDDRAPEPSPSRLGCGVAIDDAGRIIGAQYWDFQYAAAPSYLYFTGVLQDVPQTAAALSNRGDMAGTAVAYISPPRGWVRVGGVLTFVGTFGGVESSATAVNERGQATGCASDRIHLRAFLYSGDVLTNLPGLDGFPDTCGWGINRFAQVVGEGSSSDAGARAILYSEGVTYDLNSLVDSDLNGATLTSATGINDDGMIVANSCCMAFRLQLAGIGPDTSNIPALSNAVLAMLCLLMAVTGAALLPRR